MCVTLFLLLPISFSGPCVSFLAYSFHLCGVFFGLILFTITSIICIYSSYLLVSLIIYPAQSSRDCRRLFLPRPCRRDYWEVCENVYRHYPSILPHRTLDLSLHICNAPTSPCPSLSFYPQSLSNS